jgi:hypothetical protein
MSSTISRRRCRCKHYLPKIVSGKHKKCGLTYTVISVYELNELTILGQLLHRLCLFVHEAIECDDAPKLWGRGGG